MMNFSYVDTDLNLMILYWHHGHSCASCSCSKSLSKQLRLCYRSNRQFISSISVCEYLGGILQHIIGFVDLFKLLNKVRWAIWVILLSKFVVFIFYFLLWSLSVQFQHSIGWFWFGFDGAETPAKAQYHEQYYGKGYTNKLIIFNRKPASCSKASTLPSHLLQGHSAQSASLSPLILFWTNISGTMPSFKDIGI